MCLAATGRLRKARIRTPGQGENGVNGQRLKKSLTITEYELR